MVSYKMDFQVNCHGDCFSTASGIRLEDKEPGSVAACPQTYAFGTVIDIDGYGPVECIDRGGAIVSREECAKRGGQNCADRIDVWMGFGSDAVDRIKALPGGIVRAKINLPIF